MTKNSCVEHTGRDDEVDSQQVTRMAQDMLKFGDVVARREKSRFLELNAKFEEILKTYEER